MRFESSDSPQVMLVRVILLFTGVIGGVTSLIALSIERTEAMGPLWTGLALVAGSVLGVGVMFLSRGHAFIDERGIMIKTVVGKVTLRWEDISGVRLTCLREGGVLNRLFWAALGFSPDRQFIDVGLKRPKFVDLRLARRERVYVNDAPTFAREAAKYLELAEAT